ncbi:hypothetical protein [Planktomarina sp.]|uniref:hypothetical protein n=1 Tax=Planktomarina sp. TaxID=2024851 RepID=UPI0032602ACB
MLRDEAYSTSADLAAEKGSFPLYQHDYYTVGNFFKTLPDWVQSKIKAQGIRNSHLTSIAPTGTISLTADNVSSGIEPPFSLYYDRTIQLFDGAKTERVRGLCLSIWCVGQDCQRDISARPPEGAGVSAAIHRLSLLKDLQCR